MYLDRKEDMIHIYNCKILNNGSETKLDYQKIYTGTISEQIEIFIKFESNMDKREKLLTEDTSPRDPSVIHCIFQSIHSTGLNIKKIQAGAKQCQAHVRVFPLG